MTAPLYAACPAAGGCPDEEACTSGSRCQLLISGEGRRERNRAGIAQARAALAAAKAGVLVDPDPVHPADDFEEF